MDEGNDEIILKAPEEVVYVNTAMEINENDIQSGKIEQTQENEASHETESLDQHKTKATAAENENTHL